MIEPADLVAYVLYAAAVVICVVKMGLLFRLRTALLSLPADMRGVLTILTDNNLIWCLTMALTGGVIILRVLGLGDVLVGRFTIFGALVGGSFVGLIRLGNWFLYDDHAARVRPDGSLSAADELTRMRLALDRLTRALEEEGGDVLREQRAARGIPDGGGEGA
jgi:hypothetical protein